jgi:hypothetical protein
LSPTPLCSRAIGPTAGVDLWWSGKHHHHGGNVQVITAPDGWPLWTSDVRPGREHDTTCARTHPELLPALDVWIDSDHAALGDLGYEGENQRLTCPIKATAGQKLTDTQRTVNTSHSATTSTDAQPDQPRAPTATDRGSMSFTLRIREPYSVNAWRFSRAPVSVR